MAIAVKADTRAGPVLLDARKVMYLPTHGALLLGDIHFEKASYLQVAGGHPLPAYDTRDNLDRLAAVMRLYRPRTVVALGDSFHDIGAGERLANADRDRLNTITSGTEMIWVLGNHDPDIPEGVAGRREDHIELGGFLLTHHPHASHDGGVNICGHLHPKARVRMRGRTLTGPCFAVCPERIVVPSFGAYTGGLYVTDPAFAAEVAGPDGARACRYYMISRGAVSPIDPLRLI